MPILEKVITYCEHIKDNEPPVIEKPLKSANMNELVSKFYAQFIDLEE